MKKRIISFILCVALCCAIFPASAFAVGTDTQQGGYYQGSESPAALALKEFQEYAFARIDASVEQVHEKNLSVALRAAFPASTSGYGYLDPSFENGTYGKAFIAAWNKFTADQLENLVAVVNSQVNYHESNSPSKLSGTDPTGTGNYTEYGRWWGNNGVAWGGYFADWCANHAGLGISFMGMSKKTYDSSKIAKGDVVVLRNGENIGIVVNKVGAYLYVVEGNYSDKVTLRHIPITSSELTQYATPNYSRYANLDGYWYFVNADGSKKTGWLESGDEWYYFDPSANGKMVVGHWTIDGKDYDFNSTGALVSGTP